MKFLYFLPTLTLNLPAATDAPSTNQLQWWEIATGIIGVFGGFLGLILTIQYIRETNIKIRKGKLEIWEKEQKIKVANTKETDIIETLASPIFEAKNIQFFVLRFISLWVVLELWDILGGIFTISIAGVSIAIQQFKLEFMEKNNWFQLLLFLIMNLPIIGKMFIIFGLGIPLLRDVNSILGIKLGRILGIKQKKPV